MPRRSCHRQWSRNGPGGSGLKRIATEWHIGKVSWTLLSRRPSWTRISVGITRLVMGTASAVCRTVARHGGRGSCVSGNMINVGASA